MKDLSVIIVNYHTFEVTCKCIASIISKTVGVDYEIVVVDNGSADDESLYFQTLFPTMKYIKPGGNLGFSRANNVGIERADGEFILLLNSDTELLNNALFEGMQIMKSDEEIGVLSGQLLYPNGQVQAVAGVFPGVGRQLKELLRMTRFYKGKKRAAYYLFDLWNYDEPVEADWVWGAFFMFRKKDLQAFPQFRLHDTFFMYYEDLQWCYYFKKILKKKIVYSPHPKAIHHLGKSDQAITENDRRYLMRILPNEYAWMSMTKGILYAKLYYLLKGVFYLTLRRKEDVAKAKLFLKLVFRGFSETAAS